MRCRYILPSWKKQLPNLFGNADELWLKPSPRSLVGARLPQSLILLSGNERRDPNVRCQTVSCNASR